MSDTPETDALEQKLADALQEVDLRTLDFERMRAERNEARHEIEGWRNKWECAVEMAARAENESEEQARLLGMSAEREESLRGKLFLAERELAKLKEAAKAVVNRWELPSWKDSEPTAVVIYKLRDTLNLEVN